MSTAGSSGYPCVPLNIPAGAQGLAEPSSRAGMVPLFGVRIWGAVGVKWQKDGKTSYFICWFAGVVLVCTKIRGCFGELCCR